MFSIPFAVAVWLLVAWINLKCIKRLSEVNLPTLISAQKIILNLLYSRDYICQQYVTQEYLGLEQ